MTVVVVREECVAPTCGFLLQAVQNDTQTTYGQAEPGVGVASVKEKRRFVFLFVHFVCLAKEKKKGSLFSLRR